VKYLIKKGVNLNELDNNGSSPIDMAKPEVKEEIIKIITGNISLSSL